MVPVSSERALASDATLAWMGTGTHEISDDSSESSVEEEALGSEALSVPVWRQRAWDALSRPHGVSFPRLHRQLARRYGGVAGAWLVGALDHPSFAAFRPNLVGGVARTRS